MLFSIIQSPELDGTLASSGVRLEDGGLSLTLCLKRKTERGSGVVSQFNQYIALVLNAKNVVRWAAKTELVEADIRALTAPLSCSR